MYPEEKDVTLVISADNYPTVWTVTCPSSTWAQCDCHMGMRGNICKHHVKVFKLLYCIVEETEDIMGDSSIKKYVQGEEATERNHDEEKTQILVMQNKCNTTVITLWSLVLFLRVLVWDVTREQGRTNIRLNNDRTQL